MRVVAIKPLAIGCAAALAWLAGAALAADQATPAGTGMRGMSPGTMGHETMQGGGSTGMAHGRMHGGGPMMGSGMMHRDSAMQPRQPMGQGPEAHGPRHGGGLLGLEGQRVVPLVRLTADDVRLWLEAYLEQIGNPRLKVGSVEEADGGTVRAEIVTVDDSLVESLAVDRRTGRIEPRE